MSIIVLLCTLGEAVRHTHDTTNSASTCICLQYMIGYNYEVQLIRIRVIICAYRRYKGCTYYFPVGLTKTKQPEHHAVCVAFHVLKFDILHNFAQHTQQSLSGMAARPGTQAGRNHTADKTKQPDRCIPYND